MPFGLIKSMYVLISARRTLASGKLLINFTTNWFQLCTRGIAYFFSFCSLVNPLPSSLYFLLDSSIATIQGEVVGTIIVCNTTACNTLSIRWLARADLHNTFTIR